MEIITVKPAEWLAVEYDRAEYRKDLAEQKGIYESESEVNNAFCDVNNVREDIRQILSSVTVGEVLEDKICRS